MVRLDPTVDCPEGGRSLRVVEVEAAHMPLGPRNPHGIGFDIVERTLETEQTAQRDCAPEKSRVWKVRCRGVGGCGGVWWGTWCGDWSHSSLPPADCCLLPPAAPHRSSTPTASTRAPASPWPGS